MVMGKFIVLKQIFKYPPETFFVMKSLTLLLKSIANDLVFAVCKEIILS